MVLICLPINWNIDFSNKQKKLTREQVTNNNNKTIQNGNEK